MREHGKIESHLIRILFVILDLFLVVNTELLFYTKGIARVYDW